MHREREKDNFKSRKVTRLKECALALSRNSLNSLPVVWRLSFYTPWRKWKSKGLEIGSPLVRFPLKANSEQVFS